MSAKHFKSKILPAALMALLFCLVISACFLLSYRKRINDITLFSSYRVADNPDCPAQVALLKSLARYKRGISLQKATDASHLYIRLLTTGEAADAYGLSMNSLSEDGYSITRAGNTLYLLSPGEQGLNRAVYYLVDKLIDENGRLLIDLDETRIDYGKIPSKTIQIAELDIENYSIYYHEGASSIDAVRLDSYICGAAGLSLPVTDKCPDTPYLELSVNSDLETDWNIDFDGYLVKLTGRTSALLETAIAHFANRYLGWIHAGTEEEHVSNSFQTCSIEEPLQDKVPWIEEREAIITLWNVNYSRGIFLNNSTSLKPDIMSFSADQLYDYVRMLKFCGFNGIQVTDMCSAWAGAGGYEFVHDKLRILADAAHSMDMKFTLWVWGSEFTGYGWVDESVTYDPGEYEFASQNPAVLATFEKYYSIYAELAEYCDRVICHFYDPGNLVYAQDVAFFARELREKFTAINPDIDFGVSCWVDRFDKNYFIQEMGNDITLYEAGHHDDPSTYESFRNFCRNAGCRNGVWAWNTCEMEIDQLAQMNYNPAIIQSVYQTASGYDEIAEPTYWSEMDSYHILNVFSLYCAGHLLTDPGLDTDVLTAEVSEAFVGSEYASAFYEILKLIEDARSGDSWNTYWWTSEDYILKSDAYPAQDILARSQKAMDDLQMMIDNPPRECALPLPIPSVEVMQLIMPHLKQIHAFARFRLDLADAKVKASSGSASAEELSNLVQAMSAPIPEYNCIIGLWGQIEARAQQEMLLDFCHTYGLSMPIDPTFDRERKFRIYSYFITCQKGKKEPVAQLDPYFQHGLAYGVEVTRRLVEEMIEEGLLTRDEEHGVYLTDWEHYSFAFN